MSSMEDMATDCDEFGAFPLPLIMTTIVTMGNKPREVEVWLSLPRLCDD